LVAALDFASVIGKPNGENIGNHLGAFESNGSNVLDFCADQRRFAERNINRGPEEMGTHV